jgi:ectoine hydroxylase-related dioxygenase (phytanoyl-CoA dioxygenase family)
MSTDEMVQTAGIRAVTQDEIATYRANGWVKLDRFFKPEFAIGLLERLHRVMEAQGEQENPFAGSGVNMFKAFEDPSRYDDVFQSFTHSFAFATAAAALMGRPERFYEDKVLCKEPAAQGGGVTPWHQDFSYHPFDRKGTLLFWIPLVDCPPEKGTMRFLNGSHRAGLLGRFVHRTDGHDLLDEYAGLADEHPVSEPIHLAPGDVTVHDRLTVHYAPENETDTPRWVYTVSWFNADALYTGMPCHRMDGLGLKVNAPLNHPNFPTITT